MTTSFFKLVCGALCLLKCEAGGKKQFSGKETA